MSDKTILVIDDHMPIRELIARKLELEGFTVLRAKDGKEGLAAVQENAVHLIVVDLMMPVMDGLEFLRRLRSEDNKVPAIVLSASGTQSREEELIDAGATAVLAKPVQPTVIRATIDQIFTKARRI